jgi:hypothetical protein
MKDHKGEAMKKVNSVVSVMISLFLSSASVNALAGQTYSQESYEVNKAQIFQSNSDEDTARNSALIKEQGHEYSLVQLEQMLAPIALYPDSLLTHILIASTYPLEVVQAERWLSLDKHKNISTDVLLERVNQEEWDSSIQALIAFPNVVERMSNNLDWTQQLGEAFLQNEARVLASIQSLRNKAMDAGNLTQMDNVDISYEDNNIVIQPIEREVVYVPYYDTRVIYGRRHWLHNPPVYWVNRHHHFRPYHGLFSWDAGVRLSFNVFFGAFHWRDHHVVVHHKNHFRGLKHNGYRHTSYDRPKNRWQHDRKHRRGVVYRNAKLHNRFDNKIKNKHQTSFSKRVHSNVHNNNGNHSDKNRGRSLDKHQRINKHFNTVKVANKDHNKKRYSANTIVNKRAHNPPVRVASQQRHKKQAKVNKYYGKQKAIKTRQNADVKRYKKVEPNNKSRVKNVHLSKNKSVNTKAKNSRPVNRKHNHKRSAQIKKHSDANNNRN